ncbi:MAG: hypothetical protein IJ467_05325 [Bacteroidaceae bacterium]|nr:hypothetical protein [Bacteroidaceae bacterium]
MKKYFLFLGIALAATAPLALSANDDDNLTTEENQEVVLSNVNSTADENTLKVPVTANVSGNVLNVRFTGTVPLASVSVTNTSTGASVNQSLSAPTGTTLSVPVVSGSYVVSVYNNGNGQGVSGGFIVNDSEE